MPITAMPITAMPITAMPITAMPIHVQPEFKPYADKLLSGEAHLLLVVGEVARRYAMDYTTTLDWVLAYLDDALGRG
jgi:hypothetical protein